MVKIEEKNVQIKIDQLEKNIFDEADGIKLNRLIKRLVKLSDEKTRERILEILMQYTREGRVLHFRNFILTDIIKLVGEREEAYGNFFSWSIMQPALAYWSVDGLLKTRGEAAYPLLVEVVKNEETLCEIKAKAIKEMAVFSGQDFDRELPSDPGHWKSEALRVDEVLRWAESGYPTGSGYAKPTKHSSLDHPKTRLELAAAKLDRKLERERRKEKVDPANPKNYLVAADEQDLERILAVYSLPQHYLTFLRLYSPLNVWIEIRDEDFSEVVHLYGAKELIKRQDGYAYNPVRQEKIADWPSNLLVIADVGGDPICIDLGAVQDDDAPISFAEHGQGQWDFQPYADSFLEFLHELI